MQLLRYCIAELYGDICSRIMKKGGGRKHGRKMNNKE